MLQVIISEVLDVALGALLVATKLVGPEPAKLVGLEQRRRPPACSLACLAPYGFVFSGSEPSRLDTSVLSPPLEQVLVAHEPYFSTCFYFLSALGANIKR